MITTIIAASTATVAPLPEKSESLDTARFLACIAAVEGHAWSDAGGAYAIQPATWAQHAPHKAYRLASVPLHADGVALAHIAWLSRSLRGRNFPANPYTLAGAWRFGLEGFTARAARSSDTIDYAARVFQLYHSAHQIPLTTP